MINIRKELMKEAKGREYWKLRLGFTDLPEYACRNIQDFLENINSVEINREVIIPRVIYFPNSKTDDKIIHLPIKFKDESGEIETYVRPLAFHTEGGKFMTESLDFFRGGDMFTYAVFRRGYYDGTTFSNKDEKIYLTRFLGQKIPKPKSGLSDLIIKLESFIPNLIPSPEPVLVKI